VDAKAGAVSGVSQAVYVLWGFARSPGIGPDPRLEDRYLFGAVSEMKRREEPPSDVDDAHQVGLAQWGQGALPRRQPIAVKD